MAVFTVCPRKTDRHKLFVITTAKLYVQKAIFLRFCVVLEESVVHSAVTKCKVYLGLYSLHLLTSSVTSVLVDKQTKFNQK